jgi:hypothetical protein
MNLVDELMEIRSHLKLKMGGLYTVSSLVLAIAGIATLVFGFMQEELQVRTWGSLLLANFFFFSISLGGLVFSLIQDLLGAHWGRPIKRINEGFARYLPISALVFGIMFLCIKLRLLGAGNLYSWIADPNLLHHFWGKRTWLTEWFMLGRDIAALVILYLISSWYFRMTLKRDDMMMQGHVKEAKIYAKAIQSKIRYWAGPLLFLIAILFSLLAFDLTMSLAPTWFSTLWGGWSFAIMMQTLMATMLLFMFGLRGSAIGPYMKQQQFHDVGKLMHGFTIFFAYLTYAHILTYWYANMPETSEYFIHRLHQPWLTLILIAPILSFVIPLFALIPKASKWNGVVAIPVAILILAAQFLAYIIVVIPSVVAADQWAAPTIELGIFAGILSLFLFSFAHFAKNHPMMALGDPLLPAAYEHH